MIDILCYRLLKDQSFLDIFVKNKTRLSKVASRPKLDESEYWRVLDLICSYHSKHKELPSSSDLWNFLCLNHDLGVTEAWTAVLKEALNDLKEIEPVRLKQCTDPNVLIEETILQGRIENQKHIFQSGVDIAIQGPSQIIDGKKKSRSGPDDAKRYVMQELSKDTDSGGEAISGSLRQNAENVMKHLMDIFNSDDSDRLLLGFEQADEAFLIGKRFLKFLGILGFSNEGKSLLLRTLAYNFALQGHKTLFVTLEGEDALDCMTKFAFLHGSNWHGKRCPISTSPFFKEHADKHEGCTYSLPSYEEWKQKKVSQLDFSHVNWAVAALKLHEVPLYVYDRKTMGNWEAIEAAVEAEKYECVVIDYMSILDIPDTKDKDRDFAVTALYDKAASLTGRLGTVIVTPLQVNREGKKQADGKDPHQERIYSLVHVSKHSRTYENMDLVMGVVSSPEMKQIGEIKLEFLKVREGDYPKDFFADVNIGTKHVRQLGGIARDKGKEWAKAAKEQETKMMDPDFSPM